MQHLFTTRCDGDMRSEENIEELNHKYCFSPFSLPFIHKMKQIHSDRIVIVDKNSPTVALDCDAILTQELNTPLMVLVADCIPVLLYDKVQGAIGAVHSGREGTFLQIASKSVLAMGEHFGSKACDIEVYFGASIKKCCYEVSPSLAQEASELYDGRFVNGRYLDLPAMTKDDLMSVGVLEKNIDISSDCTKCDEGYFSYRKDATAERFAGIIELD